MNDVFAPVMMGLAFAALIIMVLLPIIIIFSKKNKPVGTIVVYDNDGNYEWHFAFAEGVTYDAIANMDQATFKIKKGDKTNDIHGSDSNNDKNKQ